MFNALLMAPREGGNTALIFLVQMVAFIAIFWFLLIRPQKKEQQRREEMLKAVTKGDEIVTNGGIVGKVVRASDHRLTVKTGSAEVEIDRLGVARVLNGKGDAKDG